MVRRGSNDCVRPLKALDGLRRALLAQVALKSKEVLDAGDHAPVLIFDDLTGEQIEVDFRGTPEDVLRRLAADFDANEHAGCGSGPVGTARRRAGPGAPSWASSPARSRCYLGIGTG